MDRGDCKFLSILPIFAMCIVIIMSVCDAHLYKHKNHNLIKLLFINTVQKHSFGVGQIATIPSPMVDIISTEENKSDDNPIQIYIKTITEGTIAMEIDPKQTIQNIKITIEQETNIKIQHQSLIYEGRVLTDADKTVKNYNIRDYSTIYVVENAIEPPINIDELNEEKDEFIDELNDEKEDELMSDNDVIQDIQYNPDEELVKILKANKLYDTLYDLLTENSIDLDTLKNDISDNDIDDFCKDLEIKGIKKVKFKKLLRILKKPSNNNRNEEKRDEIADVNLIEFLDKHKLPSTLYRILSAEGVGYDELTSITANDIDKICDNNNIRIGLKIKFKNAIKKLKGPAAFQPGGPINEMKNDNNNNEAKRLMNLAETYYDKKQYVKAEEYISKSLQLYNSKQANELLKMILEAMSNDNDTIRIRRRVKDYNNERADDTMKVVFIGDSGVGKTSLIERYIRNKFSKFHSSLGVDNVLQ